MGNCFWGEGLAGAGVESSMGLAWSLLMARYAQLGKRKMGLDMG